MQDILIISVSRLSMVAGLCCFVFSPRKDATQKAKKIKRHVKRRKDAMQQNKKTLCKKTRRRKDAMQKDEITPSEKMTNTVLSHGVFSSFALRFFVFSSGVFSPDEKTK